MPLIIRQSLNRNHLIHPLRSLAPMFSISKLVFAGIAALTAVNATPLIQERQAGLVVTPGPTVECTESKISWSGFADVSPSP